MGRIKIKADLMVCLNFYIIVNNYANNRIINCAQIILKNIVRGYTVE